MGISCPQTGSNCNESCWMRISAMQHRCEMKTWIAVAFATTRSADRVRDRASKYYSLGGYQKLISMGLHRITNNICTDGPRDHDLHIRQPMGLMLVHVGGTSSSVGSLHVVFWTSPKFQGQDCRISAPNYSMHSRYLRGSVPGIPRSCHATVTQYPTCPCRKSRFAQAM